MSGNVSQFNLNLTFLLKKEKKEKGKKEKKITEGEPLPPYIQS